MNSVGLGGKAIVTPIRQHEPSSLGKIVAQPKSLPRPRTFFWLFFACVAFWGVVIKLLIAFI